MNSAGSLVRMLQRDLVASMPADSHHHVLRPSPLQESTISKPRAVYSIDQILGNHHHHHHHHMRTNGGSTVAAAIHHNNNNSISVNNNNNNGELIEQSDVDKEVGGLSWEVGQLAEFNWLIVI